MALHNLKNPTHDIHLRRWLPALFGILDDDYLESLIANKVHWVELAGNEMLFAQDTEGDKMYILISGRLQVEKTDKLGVRHVEAQISQGELVGELAVISGKKRTNSVVALRDSILACITRETYFEIAERFPQHTLYMANMIIDRLTHKFQENKNLRERWNIALIPITPSVNIAEFTQTIKPYLQKYGRTLHLNNALINEYLGYENIAQVGKDNPELYQKLTFWIDRYEAQYNFIVYEADDHFSEWTQRCLRQADEIIFVANSSESPKLSNLEQQILALPHTLNSQQALVLVHPPSLKMPNAAQNYLNLRPHCTRHQHVCLSSESHCDRLARYLTGQTIGWVLSGGAARGMAHIGIVKAFREAKIPVDVVGGTSFGALVSSAVAFEWSYEELLETAEKGLKNNPTGDFNWLPFLSLVKGRRVEKFLNSFVGDTNIEDTWINFYCIASNVSKARLQLFQNGLLRQAIRASISLPGVLPPVLHEGDFLVDGGIFDNLPIEPMVEVYKTHKTIAVEVGFSQRPTFQHNKVPTNGQLLRDSFKSADKKKYDMPGFLSSIVESIMLCSDYKTTQFTDKVDMLMRPDLRKYGAGDWKKYRQLIDDGYRYAADFLEKTPFII